MENKLKQGLVCIVNCDPSIGKEYKKIRPAIIIQDNEISRKSELVTVMPLSSNIKKREEDDLIIKSDNQNNLAVDSVIKVRQISTFDKRRILQPIGEVGIVVMGQMKNYLFKHFDLMN